MCGLMFWHIRNLHIAPEFIYAAAGVWASSVIARMLHRNRHIYPITNITRGFPTTLEDLPGDMTRVRVAVPSKIRWSPSQHCYVSIPGISSLGNHPFTIASIPTREDHEMVFLIRECGGFTKDLGLHAKSLSAVNLANASEHGTLTRPIHSNNGTSTLSLGGEVDQFPSPPSEAQHGGSSPDPVDVISPALRAHSLTIPILSNTPTGYRSMAPSFVSSNDIESRPHRTRSLRGLMDRSVIFRDRCIDTSKDSSAFLAEAVSLRPYHGSLLSPTRCSAQPALTTMKAMTAECAMSRLYGHCVRPNGSAGQDVKSYRHCALQRPRKAVCVWLYLSPAETRMPKRLKVFNWT